MPEPAHRPRPAWRLERTPPGRAPELMDQPDCDRSELAVAFEVLGRTARRTGGHRLLRRQLDALLADRRAGPLRLLDVGAGGGHTALAIDEHLRGLGWSPDFVLADLHQATLELCGERVRPAGGERFRLARLDGAGLPFRTNGFDVAYSTLTLHHLEEARAARFVRELARVSRWGWAVVDLRRSRVAQAAIGLLARTAWRGAAFPRADGPVSVLRSFTPSEMRRLLREAGLGSFDVEGHLVRWAARGTG